ncbi:hypothetical protein H0H93_010431 [Arthromyces matolae]|nr:hypothetical protein H0H93_010431 [Arthromyces matolae]
MTETLIVPLTGYDIHHDNSGVTLTYIVQSLDIYSLHKAALRVVDKWRLLAGRIQPTKDLSSWCISVPIQGDVSHRLWFTTSRFETALDSSYFMDKADPIRIVLQPPLKYFRHPSVPYNLQGYFSSNAPIISIHVTQFSNCVCIGVAFPHCVLDGHGIGQFVHALDDELHDRHWTIPPFSENNAFQAVLDELEAKAPTVDVSSPSALPPPRRALAPSSLINGLIVESRLAYETRYRNLDTKMVYIPAHALVKLVQKTKDEAIQSGLGVVSTSDIVSAWILKVWYDDSPKS